MAKTLIRSVYLDGVHLAAGTELTDEQAKRITNPKATEDLAVKGQDGTPTDEDTADGQGEGGEPPARKPTAAKPSR